MKDAQEFSKAAIASSETKMQSVEKPVIVRSGSVDEKTLNDPDSLVREEREALNAAIHEPNAGKDDFPDGGLQAWMVVFGVSAAACFIYALS